MTTIEQKLLEKVWLAREEQWERCQVWLKIEKSNKPICNLYNKSYCPMRCDYAMDKIKVPLYVNENIQKK